jgi:serine/threonine protein kinase
VVENHPRIQDPYRKHFIRKIPTPHICLHFQNMTLYFSNMRIAANTKLGHYEVLEPLQSGGMGEVYRAYDSQLDRVIALKVLRKELIGDAEAIARFQREAKLASSLNHPHIISIYSVVEVDGMLCIAMELVNGTTLDQWKKVQRPGLSKILEVLMQIADALAVAHASRVIHRDIKPSNILVNEQGYAKVLDFGLAKQVLREGENISQISTARQLSGENSVLGTPAYMSPEQAAGGSVDARTDIFSLGVVLYEASTGVKPFDGDSVVQILNEVINKNPAPATSLRLDLPQELQWVLERAMAKKPEARYQAMSEFATDLRRLRSKIDSGADLNARGKINLKKYGAAAIGALALFSVAAFFLVSHKPKSAVNPTTKYEQLTDFNDSAIAPAISPDGRLLAFVRGGAFGGSTIPGQIYVKLLPDGDAVQLTRDNLNKHTPAFSPDGSKIIYTTIDRKFVWDSWQVPFLGGEPSRFLPNASGLTWIDGKQLLFSEIQQGVHMGIVTATQNRVGERRVYMPTGEGSMAHRSAISPDRKWVLIVEMDGSGWLPCRLVPFDGSSSGRQVGPLDAQCTTVGWSPDGNWMYFSSNSGGTFHVWRQRFPDGTPEQLTFGSNEQEGTAVSPDGKSLITSAGVSQSSIWVHDAAGDRQLTSQGFAILPRLAPGGEKIFYLQRSGASRSYVSAELWTIELTTGKQERILPGFVISHYDISKDGKRLLFAAAEGEKKSGIWITDLDRRTPPRQLTNEGEYRAFFVDDQQILFLGQGEEKYLYRINEDGSGLKRLNETPVTYLISVSPDGHWAAVIASQVPGKDAILVKIVPLQSIGDPVLLCDSCVPGFGPGRQQAPLVSWSLDGKLLYVSLQYYGLQSKKTAVLPFLPTNFMLYSRLKTEKQFAAFQGARMVPEKNVFPSSASSQYFFSRQSALANLFRVPLPN